MDRRESGATVRLLLERLEIDVASDDEAAATPIPWDSLTLLSAISAIDELCGVVVTGKDLEGCATAADVIRMVERKKT